MTTKAGGVSFKIAGLGSSAIQTAWTDKTYHNAWLVAPKNVSGTLSVPDSSYMFGTSTPQGSITDPVSGLEYQQNGWIALQVYDQAAYGGNGDGKIDSSDSIWASAVTGPDGLSRGPLYGWIDANGNGVVDSGELKSMATLKIKSFSVSASPLPGDMQNSSGTSTDANGNVFAFKSTLVNDTGGTNATTVWDVDPVIDTSGWPAILPVTLSASPFVGTAASSQVLKFTFGNISGYSNFVLEGVSLEQQQGKSCSPLLLTAVPITATSTGGVYSAQVTWDLSSCDSTSQFALTAGYSADANSVTYENEIIEGLRFDPTNAIVRDAGSNYPSNLTDFAATSGVSLGGSSLAFELASTSGTDAARVFNMKAYNTDNTTSSSISITGVTITQESGTSCTITNSTTFPLSVTAPTRSTPTSFSLTFVTNGSGCGNTATFSFAISYDATELWSGNNQHYLAVLDSNMNRTNPGYLLTMAANTGTSWNAQNLNFTLGNCCSGNTPQLTFLDFHQTGGYGCQPIITGFPISLTNNGTAAVPVDWNNCGTDAVFEIAVGYKEPCTSCTPVYGHTVFTGVGPLVGRTNFSGNGTTGSTTWNDHANLNSGQTALTSLSITGAQLIVSAGICDVKTTTSLPLAVTPPTSGNPTSFSIAFDTSSCGSFVSMVMLSYSETVGGVTSTYKARM